MKNEWRKKFIEYDKQERVENLKKRVSELQAQCNGDLPEKFEIGEYTSPVFLCGDERI